MNQIADKTEIDADGFINKKTPPATTDEVSNVQPL
jgi:hypothetical protein